MNEYKFVEEINSENIICNIYYVKSNENYINVKDSLLKILPNITDYSSFKNNYEKYYEIGPKSNFKTSWCTNVLTILNKCNIFCINSIEKHIMYKKLINFDKMTKCLYNNNITSSKDNLFTLQYIDNIQKYNKEHNLGFNKNDIDFYN